MAQYGDSTSADFENNTWTFEMRGDFKVKAGVFAILPKEHLQNLLEASKEVLKSNHNPKLEQAINNIENGK